MDKTTDPVEDLLEENTCPVCDKYAENPCKEVWHAKWKNRLCANFPGTPAKREIKPSNPADSITS